VGGPPVVLSLNLHCLKTDGTAFADNSARFAAIAETIASEGVDVVLAQEVCAGAKGDARAMLLAALAKATGATWSSAIAFAHRAWEGTPEEADESVAIFARGALSDARETVHRAQGSLRRVAIGATVTVSGGGGGSGSGSGSGGGSGSGTSPVRARVYSVHLDHATAVARTGQAREIASAAMVEADGAGVAIDAGGGGVALPVIVAGDFNAIASDDAPRALDLFGFVEGSGSAATARIDHVFVHRSAPFAAAATKTLFEGALAVSDHPGVLVRFSPRAPSPVRLTRVVATGTFASPLTLRGSRAPLSWDHGWPAFPRVGPGATGVAVVTSELPAGAFSYKFLRDDTDWALGADVNGTGETDNTTTPAFP